MGPTVTAGTARSAEPRQAAVTRAADHLREAILDGRFPPGSRIRQEVIAEQLGTSRLPVREALRIIELEGLVETETNKGARVPLLGAREVDLLYQMRERLEPLALTESMPRLTHEQLDRLRELQVRIRTAPDVNEFLSLDREFHLATYACCDMEPLVTTVTRLWNSTQHYRRVFMNLAGPDRRSIADAEHDLLLEALQRGDEQAAELCLRMHIRRTRVELAQHPETFAR